MAVHSHHHRGQSGTTYLSAAAARAEADKRDAATVQKIINEVLSSPSIQGENGATMTFAKETRDLLIECCVEFITMLSSEANEIAEKDAKKTIACEHITKALEELGFADYVPELVAVADQFKNSQVVRPTVHSRRSSGGILGGMYANAGVVAGAETDEDRAEWDEQ